MLSFLKRKDSPGPANAIDEAVSVQVARTRARRRLVGAAVLLGVAIVGFPLLFETRPRPIPVDIPIEVAPRAGASAPAATSVTPAQTASRAAASKPAERVVGRSGEGGVEVPVEPAAPVAAAPTPAPASAVARAPATSAPLRADRPAASAVATNRTGPDPTDSQRDAQRDAQRAQALLDGKADVAAVTTTTAESAAASEPRAARFVVQAGAYTDTAALREARQKVEKLGMKSYTQVVDTESGARTRVRVGPFATRDEAEKAAARIKGSGLAANVLSL